MNKKELVDIVARDTGMTKKDSRVAVDAITSNIEGALENGEKASFVGFGSFSVARRAARKGHNPQTGEPIDIPAKNVVKFKPSKNLKAVVND